MHSLENVEAPAAGANMHTLQRNGDAFAVFPETEGTKCNDAPFIAGLWEKKGALPVRPDYAQWKHFVETGQTLGLPLRKTLLESWQRCRTLEVNPDQGPCWDLAPMHQIEPLAEKVKEMTEPLKNRIYKTLRGNSLIMTITDSTGRIMRTCGDKNVLLTADKLNYGPGANWSEASMGTSAVGTSLAIGTPIQVFGTEHFCRCHHSWGCSTAPIFTPCGTRWGCFNIAGPLESDHSQTLALVISAAREIERLLFLEYMSDMQNASWGMLPSFLNAVQTGVLVVDDRGRITYANACAESLLHAPRPLRGQIALSYLDYATFLRQRRKNPANVDTMTIACPANPRLTGHVSPLADGHKTGHAVITLVQQSEAPRRAACCSDRFTLPSPRGRQTRGEAFGPLLYRNAVMADAVLKARQAARTPSTVLLTGETGTGKELFAKAMHEAGGRASGPFVALNCGALPKELIQSELFGYAAGSFTGALGKGKAGKFQLADQGTLFLDEISEMPLDVQVNLLRPLEDRAILPVGGSRSHPVNIKIIAATNRDLEAMTRHGTFREDLYYRIKVVHIHIPPLRERREDIPLLIEHHVRRLSRALGRSPVHVSAEAMELLCTCNWPGNVRELFNNVEHALNTMQGSILLPEHLPSLPCPETARDAGAHAGAPTVGHSANERQFRLDSLEINTIRDALAYHQGNVSRAAKSLGISRNTLYTKLRRAGLDGA